MRSAGTTVRHALDQRELWSPTLDGTTRELVFLCQLDAGTTLDQVLDNQRSPAPAAAGPAPSASPAPAAGPPSSTSAQLERDPRLVQALEHGNVHYRVMWLITRRPQLTRPALLAAATDTNTEVTQALDDLATHGLVRMLPDGTLRAAEQPPPY